ncbi:aldehyde dehydrogenase family protein [Tunicatimonas pelagia]|uniref:aldehyde dehydrogenase family protein n=1 Tax=Tunicatimonas pelagia TaxID=931531 RepID=UPI00266527E2|nr:aldehyde dehydrogenase family protein [Tunicatimonas pelagia]WKN46004.1 aldehyde dehydrogenase family protein [Tunicatimonas pelagia]
MVIINPATEATITTVQEDTAASAQEKYERVRQGQPTWYQTPIAERIAAIAQFSELLQSQADELAKTLTQEMGKPLNQAHNELNGARGRIQYFVENSEKWLAEELVTEEEGLVEKIAYEPLGVIANISAWNYPYLVGVNVFIPALIAGNGVLYKPSEYTILTGLKIGKLLHQAGIPEDVFQVVIGDGEIGKALLELPLNGYFFTGSNRTGQRIYETVAPKMVLCQMELGGKDPLYVPNDNVNVAKVAQAAAEGAFYNNGQSCCAVERIYVHQAIYDEFLEAFTQEVQQLKLGNPEEEGVFIGPLARQEQIAVLEQQVQDALDKEAQLLTGGKKANRTGYYFEPTVFTDVNHQMQIMREESFGPIIGIQRVADDNEAIALMQDTDYGLTAAVYCDTQAKAETILAKIDSGTAYWNCCDRVSATLPWSGRKKSGIGTTLSYHGIRIFTKPKAYHLRKG